MIADSSRECPKCRSRMERGFTIDHGDYSTLKVAEWVEGPPERSFWTGLRTKGREVLPIATYRCERCGYLESYAPAG